MAEPLDLLTIGTGAAASTAAYKCREAGWEVAVVDRLPYGGTCSLRGCDPKKVFVELAAVADRVRRLQGKGLRGGTDLDWAELQAFKRSFTDPVPQEREGRFQEAGIMTLHGNARFTGPNRVVVGPTEVAPRHVLIATGARPRPLDIPGEELLSTSTGFLELDALPERIVFVGGGYISFEFAHVAVRCGAQVAVLHRDRRPLAAFAEGLVQRLVQATRALGVDVRLEADVEAIEREGEGLVVKASGAGGGSFPCDVAVHGAGRVPALQDLDLEAGQVRHGPKGVEVNEHLRSVSNPSVYAAGDAAATPGPKLTPVAANESHIVAANLLGDAKRFDHSTVPSVVFTVPPLARVGLDAEQSRKQGVRVRIVEKEIGHWYSSRREGDRWAAVQVVIEAESDRVVGAHLLGSGMDEMINLFGLAIENGLTAADLKRTTWAYPTQGADLPHMV